MENKKRIVVVEDEPHISNLIRLSLDSKKFEVTEVFSGHKFLDLIKKEKVDLITMDIMMPGLDGLTLLKRMNERKDLKDIPVIIISAKNELKDKINSINAGAVDYLEKPFDPAELNKRVIQALEM